MPGTDSSYMWQGFIPRQDNPHVLNPSQGYISSANQRPVDSTYPYFIPGHYALYRGISINRRLSRMTDITTEDMKKLQTDNYNVFAEHARPILLKYADRNRLNADAKRFADMFARWDLVSDPGKEGPTVLEHWIDTLSAMVFRDELLRNGLPVTMPDDFILVQYLIRDSTAFRFTDDVNTPAVETLTDMVTEALNRASVPLSELERNEKLTWGRFRDVTLYHLLRTNMLPFARKGLDVGGGQHIINATKHAHGPSWRMIVSLTTPIEAYGVYPGGQSGNPGSPFYDDMAGAWAKGEYYRLWIMKRDESGDKRIRGRLTFN